MFGRFNLIDTAVVAVLLVLVPLGYVAYRLFRPEPIKITSIEPARVIVGQQPRIRISGEHFKPFLRVQIGPEQAHTLLIETPNSGEMVLPELPAGTYDVAMFDEVSEVARLKNALTVEPPPAGPAVKLQLIGTFFGLDEAAARAMTAGRKFPNDPGATIEIVEAGAPREDVRRVRPVVGSEALLLVPVTGMWQVPATIRAVCLPGAGQSGERQNCAVNGAIITPGVTVPIPGGFSFVADTARVDAPAQMVTARVQFTGPVEVIDLIAQGDTDASGLPDSARVMAIRDRQSMAGELATQTTNGGVLETMTTPARFGRLEADVRMAVDQAPSGLEYRAYPLKPGALFTFETSRYVARGAILAVTPAPGGRAQ